MPDTNHFTGLPVPIDGEASDGPAAFLNFRAALAGHTVLFATDTSNRDSLYADAPVGTLCASTASPTVWLKTAPPNTWVPIYSDTGWVSLASAGWQADYADNGSYYRVSNGRASLVINTTYTGDDYVTGGSGNISDQTVVVLPAAVQYNSLIKRVLMPVSIAGLTGVCRVAPGGAVVLMTTNPNTTVPNGAVVQGSVDYSL